VSTHRVFTLRRVRLAAVLLLFPLLTAMLAEAIGTAAPAAAAPVASCPDGPDYSNASLTKCNFAKRDLRGANFTGAFLKAVVFVGADLTGADFSGAHFLDSGNPAFPNDFTLATLTNAKFTGATFTGLTYLTYATLTCADFSNIDLSTGNAVFGPSPLDYDKNASCVAPLTRTTFASATMSCEFIDDWNSFDLTGVVVSACGDQFKGHEFSNGVYANVVFDNLDLTGSKWAGAVLDGAKFRSATLDNATGLNGSIGAPSRLAHALFNNASVQNVDLSNAQLYGADFTNAELSGSKFDGSFLSSDPKAPNTTAARFDGAHLKNVSFANAQLQSVTFNYASLYGGYGGAAPSFPCARDCASASGADLTSADFSNAFLYGVDFRGATTTLNGTKFNAAILVGASFAGAQFQVNGGAAPQFDAALLQGTVFDPGANLGGASLLDAFVDFKAPTNRESGNILYLLLGNRYSGFRNWSGSPTPCVRTIYEKFSTVPPNATMTCPNGNATVCGDGSNAQSLANWKSRIAMKSNDPVPGWYLYDATYDGKSSTAAEICRNGAQVDPKW
jgi:uncharacterized protein YjbI with pentapeptide repeats